MASDTLDEFKIIKDFFAPLAQSEAAYGLTDDAAQIGPYVITKDAIVESVHFFADDPAYTIGQKALRVNLSDLAAKGAKPVGYLLAISLPPWITSDWLTDFQAGLRADQEAFGVSLLGGDTVRTTGPLTLSITALGEAPTGGMVLRSGAVPGDRVIVTGDIGDGWLGLQVRSKAVTLSEELSIPMIARYQTPTPRVNAGQQLAEIAHASADISDGLLADAARIAQASEVRIVIDALKIPMSAAARHWVSASGDHDPVSLWTGGDDYELVMTVPPHIDISQVASRLDVPLSVIGRVEEGEGLAILGPDGQDLTPARYGYSHCVTD